MAERRWRAGVRREIRARRTIGSRRASSSRRVTATPLAPRLALLLCLVGTPLGAVTPRGLVVVINGELDLPSIDALEIRRLFLGESRTLPNGARAALAAYGPESGFFNEAALGLSDERVAAIWSRLQFSGRLPPPKVFDDAREVVDFVARTPDAIAYLPASTPREGVRVIYNLPRPGSANAAGEDPDEVAPADRSAPDLGGASVWRGDDER